ncbi:MAG: alpha/beta hydrolase-fold protein [Pseudolysinimonas sp.]
MPVIVDLAQLLLVAAVVVLALFGRRSRLGARDRRVRGRLGRGLIIAASALAGSLVGWASCWLLSDQWDLFDVSLTPVSRAWVAVAFAGVGVAVTGAALSGWRARIVATAAVVASLMAGAIGVNADFGQYTTVGSLSDHQVAPPLPASLLALQAHAAPDRLGHAAASATPSSRPQNGSGSSVAHGVVGSVVIPATVSHFAARPAYIYLPPAALRAHPVPLPVIVMLSGQPGSPGTVISSGNIAAIFDSFARSHGGVAPIVVVADQLSAPQNNPMCVDGALGASESYLTVDVPNWIRSHLTVRTAAKDWAIAGFSQGGTCAIQLGSAHPGLFSDIIDVSGQLAPKNGGLHQTIALGFGGDANLYRASLPQTVLARRAPYLDSVAVFGVGQLDTRYGPVSVVMSASAGRAGIQTTRVVSPGTGHDWHTVQWVLKNELTPIYRHMGLER